MKIMRCPLNGDRNISEFVCGGQVKLEPQDDCSDEQWSQYIFMEENPAGLIHEWWIHTPTSYWFIATRNTINEDIIATHSVQDFFSTKSSSGNAV